MRLYVFLLLLPTIFGITEISDVKNEADNSSPTIDSTDTPIFTTKPQQPECRTFIGEPGECKNFNECYPIFEDLLKTNVSDLINTAKNKDTEILSSDKALREEVVSIVTSSDDVCSKTVGEGATDGHDSSICCSIPTNVNTDSESELESAETLFHDKATATIASPIVEGATNILPQSCGNSKVSNTFFRLEQEHLRNKTLKITGGRDAQPGQFPWMVAIFGKNGKLTCGASLITNDYVLTAAHCLFMYKANDIPHLKVHLGDYNIKTLSDGIHESRKVSKIILHKGFNSKNYHNDIALMKLEKPVTYTDKIQPICLPTSDFKSTDVEGHDAIVMGWGRSRQWGSDSSVLRMVDLPVWKYSDCHKVFNVFAPNRLADSNMCAGDNKKSKDACIGDSGGPLVIKMAFRWTQIGIVSWGKGCGSFPGVYTSTVSFLPWIKKHLNNN